MFYFEIIFIEILQREDRKFLYMYLPGSSKINTLCDNLKNYIDAYNNLLKPTMCQAVNRFL